MCKIECESAEVGSLIKAFFQRQYPSFATSTSDKVDAILTILVGTLQTRLGPVPSPESLSLMREIVQGALTSSRPIPVVVPFAPKKPGKGRSIDISEVFVLRTLQALHESVAKFHQPGLDIRIRLENVVGYVLEGPEYVPSMEEYCFDFTMLNHVLGLESFIQMVREDTDLGLDAISFGKEAEVLSGAFMEYFDATPVHDLELECIPEGRALRRAGWLGDILHVTRDYYMTKYRQLYPRMADRARLEMLALYFACALLRKKKKATGNDKSWERWLQVNFLRPIPGVTGPSTVLHRRHLPMKFTHTHVTPWFAKGYLRIEENSIRPGNIHWGDHTTEGSLVPNFLIFSNGHESVRVQADYVHVREH